MKRNAAFFTTVLFLLLASSLVLTGCMYAIVSDKGATKAYDISSQSELSVNHPIIEDAPVAQNEMQKKFGVYLHEEDENTVTLFSEEQYAELKATRENGKRTPLTYDEILFLVNDSISLYFKYDEIRLTNGNRDNITPLLSSQSGNARIISTVYKDLSASAAYSEAEQAYEKMLTDIYEIIYYRIYMHDAGFEAVLHVYHSDKDLIYGLRYNTSPISSAVPVGSYQMLAIDGATFSGIDNEEKLVGEYKTLLEWKRMYEADAIIDYAHYPYLNSAVLCTSILNTVRQPMEYKFYIAGPKDDPAQQIYPTAELTAMKPRQEGIYISGNANDADWGPSFSLNDEGRFSMTLSSYQSFALIGKYDEHDGVLKLYPENVEYGMGHYSYVFHYEDGAWVYSRENSVPPEGAYDIADGLTFKLLDINAYYAYAERPIKDIVDRAEEEGIPTDDAIEPFFEDEHFVYSFSSIRSEFVLVTFADGEVMPVKDALEKGYITIRALDVYSIHYYKDAKK